MATKSKSAPKSTNCNGDCFGRSFADDRAKLDEPKTQSMSGPRIHELQSLPDYTYTSLGPSEVRVFCLAAGPRASPLEGRLITAAMGLGNGRLQAIERVGDSDSDPNKLVEFSAISYTWEGSRKLASIITAEKVIHITTNLYDALRELRKEDEAVYLWADAICINQDDTTERANQVSNMLEIYQMASKVYVWLGRADLTSQICIKRLQQLPDTAVKSANAGPLHKDVVHSESCKQTQNMLYRALQEFYSRPWLRRVWVRQEMFAAREITMMCGCDRISWNDFFQGMILFDSLEKNAVEVAEPATQARTLLQGLQNLTKENLSLRAGIRPPKDLVSTLVSSSHLEAREENDKIFALLGMCGVPTAGSNVATSLSSASKGIRISYDRSFEGILLETTLHLFNKASIIDGFDAYFEALAEIFHYKARLETNRSEISRELESIPSWVMDWRACCSIQELQVICGACALHKSRPPSPAKGGPHTSLFPMISFYYPPASSIPGRLPEVQGSTLRVRGLVLDVVELLTDRACDVRSLLASKLFGLDVPYYNPSIHTRRVAKLHGLHVTPSFLDRLDRGAKYTKLVTLIPAGTKPGDLIVVIGPGVLPLVLSPAGLQDTQEEKTTVTLSATEKIPMSKDRQQEYASKRVEKLLTKDRRYVFRGPAFASWHSYYMTGLSQCIQHPRDLDLFEFFLV